MNNPDENVEYYVVAVVRMEAEIIHTDTHPFCDDPQCPCHADRERINEQLVEPVLDGLLTEQEASRLYHDQHIA